MTDPGHPLCGQSLTVLSLVCARGPRFVAVALPDGRSRLIWRAATDLERPPQADAAAPLISARALPPLARHVWRMVAASDQQVRHADPSPPPPPAPGDAGAGAAAAAMAGAAAPPAGAAGAAGRSPAPPRPRGGAPC